MQEYKKDLGKVVMTPAGKWDIAKSYDLLCIVYEDITERSYISKQYVPTGVDLQDSRYWMPLNVSGYSDSNIIILNQKDENGNVKSYSLEKAINKIAEVGRKPGAIIGFYHKDENRLDIGGRWEIWQFDDNNIYNWNNLSHWTNIYYNHNKFVGWFRDENVLNVEFPKPEIGCYAFVGSIYNEAIIYRCDIKGKWTKINELAQHYIKVIVGENVSIGDNGNWYQDGKDTGIPASIKGDNGKTPYIRNNNNILEYSYNEVDWFPISDEVAAWFRWKNNKIQISRDKVIWDDLSDQFQVNIHIKGYVASYDLLPSGQEIGTVYGVGPTYKIDAENDPIYRIYVYTSNGWIDNGIFKGIGAGVVQEKGTSTTEVMSQDVVTKELTELGSYIDNPEFIRAYTDFNGNFLWGIKADGSIEWAKGIPTPVKERLRELEDYIQNVDSNISESLDDLNSELSVKINALERWRTSIGIESTDNPEFMAADTDADGKFLGGYDNNGKRVYPTQQMQDVVNDVEGRTEMVTDKDGNIIDYRDSKGKKYLAYPTNQDDNLQQQIDVLADKKEVLHLSFLGTGSVTRADVASKLSNNQIGLSEGNSDFKAIVKKDNYGNVSLIVSEDELLKYRYEWDNNVFEYHKIQNIYGTNLILVEVPKAITYKALDSVNIPLMDSMPDFSDEKASVVRIEGDNTNMYRCINDTTEAPKANGVLNANWIVAPLYLEYNGSYPLFSQGTTYHPNDVVRISGDTRNMYRCLHETTSNPIMPNGAPSYDWEPTLKGLTYSEDYPLYQEGTQYKAYWDFGSEDGHFYKIPDQVYVYMDKLAKEFPELIKKCDPMADADDTEGEVPVYAMSEIKAYMSEHGFNAYPFWANGISDGTYDCGVYGQRQLKATPAYKTYCYKISNPHLWFMRDSDNRGKKEVLYIQAGCHAPEPMGAVTACHIAKELVSSFSKGAYSLLNNYDVYIIPVLDNYAVYHGTYDGPTGVNVNRNYPTKGWKFLQDTTKGLVAGDYFPTRLACAMVDVLKPSVAFDLHDRTYRGFSDLMVSYYKTAHEMSQASPASMNVVANNEGFHKYFGDKGLMRYLFITNQKSVVATAKDYFFHKEIRYSGTIETISALNFLANQDGNFDNVRVPENDYSVDTMNLALLVAMNYIYQAANSNLKEL